MRKIVSLFFYLFCFVCVKAQTLKTVNADEYRLLAKRVKAYRLQKIDSNFPNVQLSLLYSTPDNFTKEIVYPQNLNYTFLSKPAYKALKKIAKALSKQNLGIKIFDAYRPYYATVKFWQLVPDDRYAANPANGSNHNRGLAIDLTLYDLTTGRELDMGTGFDNFTEKAHHSYANFSETVLKNRTLLKTTMMAFGFQPLETEWWHYTFETKLKYPVFDIPFDSVNKK